MKKPKENAVSIKNAYFCVTVFLVQFVLMIITFITIEIIKHTILQNVSTERLYFVMTPIELGLNIIIWYIAGKIGLYNIFNSKKIAKKNLLPLKKAVVKDWCYLTGIVVLLSLSNIVNIFIALIALCVNLPLLKRNFDKQAILHYGKINF